MSLCTWIVSERSDRWRRAVDSVAPAILPGGFELLSVKPEEIPDAVEQKGSRVQERAQERVRAPVGKKALGKKALTPFPESTVLGAVVVLYELPIERPRETLQALALCAAFDSPPLQLVALPAELRIEGRAELELTAALRQLGAGALLRHPEHLWQLGRLVARYARL